MALTPGTRLGPYEVLAQLGAGGMGEVFRARDTKLNREVALKVLHPSVAEDADRLARFRREAQLVSALNHPHIVTVHDVGEFEGSPYLVTEFVDGGTLKEWAAAGPRAWRQVVELLKDGATTNIWTISTETGSFRQLTGFGGRPILIARHVSWSPDARFIYAAVLEQDADIVLLAGISP